MPHVTQTQCPRLLSQRRHLLPAQMQAHMWSEEKDSRHWSTIGVSDANKLNVGYCSNPVK